MPQLYFRCVIGCSVVLLLAPVGVALAQAPVITGITPLANARAVPRTSPVTVSFNQNLTASSAGALKVFSSQRGGLRSRGATPAVVNGNAVSFAPAAYPWMPGETVQYSVTAGMVGSGGVRVGQFTTAVGGTGQGNLRPSSIGPYFGSTVGRNPISMAVGDIDGDGDLDFVAANQGSTGTTISVRVNTRIQPGGVFYSPHQVTPEVTVGYLPTSVVLGDIDSDGDLDMVSSSAAEFLVYLRMNDGTGNFVARGTNPDVLINYDISSIVLGDMDGDGDLDLVAANGYRNTVAIRFNDGTGRFSGGSNFAIGISMHTLALGDLDNDGDLDILASNDRSTTVSIRFNDGAGGFTTPIGTVSVGLTPQRLALGDVDGDGDLDLAVTNFGRYTAGDTLVSLRLNDGNGTFITPVNNAEIGVGAYPRGLAFGDIDGDGDLDLLVASGGSGFLAVRLNDGTGVFTTARTGVQMYIYGIANNVVLADVDGDGDLDALVAHNGDAVQFGMNTRASLTTVANTLAITLQLSPNPAHAATTLSGALPYAPITILDALGRPVLTATADAEGRAQLRLPTGLAPGLYLVKCGAAVRRLVVE